VSGRWAAQALVAGAALLASSTAPLGARAQEAASGRFWGHWSDGKAELDGYELVQPRYGEARRGRAVLIFVTEPFSRARRVKVDRHDPADPDQLVALKLNHVRRFQTGIYDYSLLTSIFTDPAAGFRPTKLTFSAQEWCGHVFQELELDEGGVHSRLSSYFEGEGGQRRIEAPGAFLSEDNLFITLRALGGAGLPTGRQPVTMLGSVMRSRLQHQPLGLFQTELVWDPTARELTVPAGAFEVRDVAYVRPDGGGCRFALETAYPHRIVQWSCEDGERAVLTGSARLAYWEAHGEGDEKLLEKLGLTPMPAAP
jgi:hypothetical protein